MESQAQLKNASVVANCRSLALDKLNGFSPLVGPVTNFFTTYDGTSGFPIHQDLGNGYWLFSEELRPRAGQPGIYESDYVSFDSSGYIEYGSFALNLPTTDSDGNGLPDISQKDKAVNVSVSGSATSDWSFTGVTGTASISGNFNRNANSQIGSYSVTLTGAGGSVGYTGRWGLLDVSGSTSYQRGSQNILNFNLTSTNLVGASISFNGSTTFTVNSANQIAVPQFSLTGTDNNTYTIYASVLNRSGNRYIGDWKLLDGNLLTSWPDYTNLVVEITDTNDSDGNGIPDLSDALPVAPSIDVQPQGQTVAAGGTVTFSVTASGTAPLSYQWYRNDSTIPGATAASHSINGVQPSDAGDYKVRVSNAAGSINSNPATLTVQYAPAFLTIAQQGGNQVALTISGTLGAVYAIEYCTDLAQTNSWHCLEFLQLTTNNYSWIDTTAPATDRRFYRAVATAPANLLFIPPGTYTMGSPANEEDRDSDEGPQTIVTLKKGFFMGKYPVTQGDYSAVIGSNPSYFNTNNGFSPDLTRPVETVSWNDSANYCVQRTQQELAAGLIPAGSEYRLPTEAEWEYACRAGTLTRFSYGDDPGYTNLTAYAWYGDNASLTTHSVGKKLPNPWGLYDMHGNIFEWCQDWYSTYLGGSAINPQGPASGSFRVLRGGGWSEPARGCRSANRGNYSPDVRAGYFGFRVVLVPGS